MQDVDFLFDDRRKVNMLNWIKTLGLIKIFKNIIIGAFLGFCTGFAIVIVSKCIGYSVIDLIHNVDPYFPIEHWYISWSIAGIIAKILPW